MCCCDCDHGRQSCRCSVLFRLARRPSSGHRRPMARPAAMCIGAGRRRPLEIAGLKVFSSRPAAVPSCSVLLDSGPLAPLGGGLAPSQHGGRLPPLPMQVCDSERRNALTIARRCERSTCIGLVGTSASDRQTRRDVYRSRPAAAIRNRRAQSFFEPAGPSSRSLGSPTTGSVLRSRTPDLPGNHNDPMNAL